MDESGLLRVGGRLQHSTIPYEGKHPIIIPKGHRIGQLLIADIHNRYSHPGTSLTLALLRQNYWILNGRNEVRRFLRNCVKCFRHRPQPLQAQLMGNLPSCRVNQPKRAFQQTGVDYAGPITLRLARGRNPKFYKAYIALFVCMATRAIHIELVNELTTDAFIAALKRFTSRRGLPTIIHSDNGTNFHGACRETKEMYQLLQSNSHNSIIADSISQDGIQWKFLPPHSPQFGGLWEAGVKSVKTHLKRCINDQRLTYDEMITVLCTIEAILNSRPLCAVSDDIDCLEALTPSHFLVGESISSLPEPDVTNLKMNLLSRWQLTQRIAQGFWKRWNKEYVTTLQQRSKWQKSVPNFKLDDLVLIREDNMPPTKWALGRITQLYPGKDGLIRIVDIRTKGGTYKRPITKLCLLPTNYD